MLTLPVLLWVLQSTVTI